MTIPVGDTPRQSNACKCGYVFGAVSVVQSFDGAWEVLNFEGLPVPVYDITTFCPNCGRRFYWHRTRQRRVIE
jgi:hypothetical protein